MNCPKCDKEMLEGYLSVSSGRGSGVLRWRNNKNMFKLFKDPEHFTIMSSSLFTEYVPAFRCENCKQIIFSYDEGTNAAIENKRELK